MRVDELREKVRQWDSQCVAGEAIAPAKYTSILNQIEYHAENGWKVYLPSSHHPDFNSNYMERLAAWVGNLTSTADQQLLLEYALHISFFSHDDFVAFYHTALSREVSAWIVSQIGARLEPQGGKGFHQQVYQQIHHHTWFCPVTDSMDINEFYKVNHLSGIGQRPNFAALNMMAKTNPQTADVWIRYMACPDGNPLKPTLERLVLLEDVVGSGTQCLDTVRWAAESFGKPVLFIPLILCPNGIQALRAEEQRLRGQLTVRPVLQLYRNDLLGPERQGQEGWPISQAIEELALRCSGRASRNMEPFGYRGTGCSLATFSNTPDNTLPIVHNRPRNGDWEPLFPRVYRGD